MNSILSIRRVTLLGLALGTASVTASFAQTTTTPPAPTPPYPAGAYHHHESVLTADERAQLDKARDAAMAADPSLKTDEDNMRQQFQTLKSQGTAATQDQWDALHAQGHDFHEKLRAAELKADPTLAPIFAKLDAAHKNWHHSADGNS